MELVIVLVVVVATVTVVSRLAGSRTGEPGSNATDRRGGSTRDQRPRAGAPALLQAAREDEARLGEGAFIDGFIIFHYVA